MGKKRATYTRNKIWSNEDRDFLIDEVAKSPHNLSEAFGIVSRHFGISFSSVRKKYYDDIRINNPVFNITSKYFTGMNTKNTKVFIDDSRC